MDRAGIHNLPLATAGAAALARPHLVGVHVSRLMRPVRAGRCVVLSCFRRVMKELYRNYNSRIFSYATSTPCSCCMPMTALGVVESCGLGGWLVGAASIITSGSTLCVVPGEVQVMCGYPCHVMQCISSSTKPDMFALLPSSQDWGLVHEHTAHSLSSPHRPRFTSGKSKYSPD